MDVAGEAFRKILLMIFLPLLAITFLRTPLEGRLMANLKQLGGRLLAANVIVAVLGLTIGGLTAVGIQAVSKKPIEQSQIDEQLSANRGSQVEEPYDAHPMMNAVARLIPSDPFNSAGNASGTNALQVLLLAGTIGLLLSFSSESLKARANELLKQGAAFLVKDHLYSSKSLMDFVQPLIPFGVFCLTATLACTMRLSNARIILGVLISTLISQVAIISLVGLGAWRWHPSGLGGFWRVVRLAWPGIATAGATMSSFAALPELFTLEFIKDHPERKSVLNLGITLNKMGATGYLAAAGGFITLLANAQNPQMMVTLKLVVLVLMFSIVTPLFAGGVPFAAVFALGVVLQYTTHLSGPAWWVMSIEPLVDPIVTMVNVIANLIAATCLTRDNSEPQQSLLLTAPAPAQSLA